MREAIFLTGRIALSYFVGAQLGIMLALLPNSTVTLFWPPSGIALAALLLRGIPAIPGIFLGALASVVVLVPENSILTVVTASISVSSAQTLGALMAAILLGRFVRSAPFWASARDIFLGSVCMGLGCLLSTSISIASLYRLELLNSEYIDESYGMWWLGEFCGMLIFTPLAFVAGDRISKRVRYLSKPSSIHAPTHVYSLFAAASVMGFSMLWVMEGNRITQTLQREATLAANSLTTALQTAGRDVESIGALLYARDQIRKAEFLRYADAEFGDRKEYPGAQALGWAAKVTNPGAWELGMLARGEVGLRLFEVDSDGTRIPVKDRADYFPLEYVYPLNEENRVVIGYDLGSDSRRRHAIERARDTGGLSMTAPVRLIRAQVTWPGMFMCWPIYREGAGIETVAQRRDALIGVATGVYQIGSVFDVAVSGFDADIALHLLDTSLPEGEGWYHTRPSPQEFDRPPAIPAPTLASLTAGFSGSAAVDFAGHEWRVLATPGPTFVLANRTWVPWAMLGLVLTLGFGTSSIMIERISAQKQLDAERLKTEQALQEARAANESKSYFMAAASHDIKQPLYALGILADTLLMSNPPENTKPVIKSLRKSIKEMSQHFDTLIDVGRFQDGSFEARTSTFPLRELSRRIAQEIGPLCREKGLRWTIDFDDVDVRSDPELLLRLMRNLLINAVRYTEHGGILSTAKRQGEVVEFRISDTGPGLSPDQRELVFNEVMRVRPDVIHTSGLGLGLSIVNKISRALDLGLKVSSAQGHGTTFTFRIPIDQA